GDASAILLLGVPAQVAAGRAAVVIGDERVPALLVEVRGREVEVGTRVGVVVAAAGGQGELRPPFRDDGPIDDGADARGVMLGGAALGSDLAADASGK